MPQVAADPKRIRRYFEHDPNPTHSLELYAVDPIQFQQSHKYLQTCRREINVYSCKALHFRNVC